MTTTSIGLVRALALLVTATSTTLAAERPSKPNVIIILTDDQGFGELGVTGNPVIRTPHIDRLAAQGVSLVNFHVMPVCSPTRACLMTGRYNYRTGVTDTYLGRSLMHPDETTLAEMLAAGGYRTGIFGKWHLGDNYPMRAMDKGFQESLVLNGGGLAQPGDPPDPADERGAYFNATLRHNGAWVKTKGYVSDVITEAAMQFIAEEERSAVLRVSALQLPARAASGAGRISPALPGEGLPPRGIPAERAPHGGQARPGRSGPRLRHDREHRRQRGPPAGEARRTEAGRQHHRGPLLRQRLPATQRLQRGLPGLEGHAVRGRHPPVLLHPLARDSSRPAAGWIALPPTSTLPPRCWTSAACRSRERVKFDGLSLAPLLRGQPVAWPDRVLFFQWHRGDVPERYRAFAARSQDWKLVQPLGVAAETSGTARPPSSSTTWRTTRWNCTTWPPSTRTAWRSSRPSTTPGSTMSPARAITPCPRGSSSAPRRRIPCCSPGRTGAAADASWGPKGVGYWEVNVVARARYEIKLRFDPLKTDGEATLSCGGVSARQAVKAGEAECVFRDVRLPLGPGRLEANLVKGPAVFGVQYVEVKRID